MSSDLPEYDLGLYQSDIEDCTCDGHETPWDHDHDCDLWRSPGFCAGLLEWSPVWHQLVPTNSQYEELTEEEVQDLAGVLWEEEEMVERTGRVFVADPATGELVEIEDLERPFTDDEPDKKEWVVLPSAKGLIDIAKEKLTGKSKQPTEADLIECTCTPADKPAAAHNGKCKLFNYPPWVYQECEWDHKNRRLMWYEPDDAPGSPTRLQPPMGGPKNKEIAAKDKATIEKKAGGTGFGFGWGDSWSSSYVAKDRHKEQPVEFPDGTTVYGSSSFSRSKGDQAPDFGLYLAGSWNPASVATFIPWIDHGLPDIRWDHAIGAIIEAFERAKAGFTVEVGCIGGHGRTGTVLACMAVLAGVSPDDACAWVWANYCEHAIESDDQIWWVEWFASKVSDWPEPLPIERIHNSAEPKPPPKKWENTSASAEGKKGTPNKDVPFCGDCGEPRWEKQSYLCNKSGCKGQNGRNNFTTGVGSENGKKALASWRGKGKNANPPKAKTPPKSTSYYGKDAEKSGITTADIVEDLMEVDEFVPICAGCQTTRFREQTFICRNPRCRPNYTISVSSPRGKKILQKWANARAHDKVPASS